MLQTDQNKINAAEGVRAYRRGYVREGTRVHVFKPVAVYMDQDDRGEWRMFINGSEHGLPPTDVEISLWIEAKHATIQPQYL
jgi:hypothetical protein